MRNRLSLEAFQNLTNVRRNVKISLETKKVDRCVLSILSCVHWMLDNIPTDEKETRGSRTVIVQNDTENSLDGSSKQQVSLIGNGNIFRIRKS